MALDVLFPPRLGDYVNRSNWPLDNKRKYKTRSITGKKVKGEKKEVEEGATGGAFGVKLKRWLTSSSIIYMNLFLHFSFLYHLLRVHSVCWLAGCLAL